MNVLFHCSRILEFVLDSVEGEEDLEDANKVILYTVATQQMRDNWNNRLCGIYDHVLHEKPAGYQGEDPRTATKFCWFARYCASVSCFPRLFDTPPLHLPKGDGAPQNVPAQCLVADSLRTNRLPYQSAETVKFSDEYVSVTDGLSTFFAFVDALVCIAVLEPGERH
jgi:hypothetical protein